MNYQDIAKANSEITMLDLKGKDYAMVPERVTAFRKLFPEGFIRTEIISHEDGVVLMQASVGYYNAEGCVILGTGYAQEVKGKGLVNGTSYIENCETSAVGRALGFLGLGINGGGICSAEELANAVTAQKQMKTPEKFVNDPMPGDGNVTKQNKLPDEAQNVSPVMSYLMESMKMMREARQISAGENNKLFKAQRDALVKAKLAPDKKLEEYTMEEAQDLVNAMYKCFTPTGTELKVE